MGINEGFKNLSISLKFAILVAYFLFTITGMLATVYYFHIQGAQDSSRVDVAGAQRMLSQRMAKQALGIALGNEALRADLGRTINEYDNALKNIEQGGAARGYVLPPAPKEAMPAIERNRELWRAFKPNIESITITRPSSSEFSQALEYMLKNNDEILSRSNDVVVVLTELSNARFTLMNRILFVFFSLAVVVAIVAYLPYKREMVDPIVALAERARNIGKGDLSSGVAGAERRDEIGVLAKSLEETIKELDDLHTNIARKIEERTLKLEEANRSMHEYAKELKRASELKELFADIMRHDLTNYISVIKGILELWKDEGYKVDKEEVQMLLSNIRKIADLITNATILSKMEATTSLEFVESDIGDAIKDAGKSIQDLAEGKNIEIVWDFEKGHIAQFHSSVEHAFMNLLSNAVKYSPAGSKVMVNIEDRGDNLRIAVRDQGAGIPSAYKKSIFDRFTRREKGGVKGTGLGLAIAKRVVELHHGRIWDEDNPGGGSVFYVELPKTHPSI